MERLDYKFLFRWFVGMDLDEKAWTPTVPARNRERLLEGEVAARFLAGSSSDRAATSWVCFHAGSRATG